MRLTVYMLLLTLLAAIGMPRVSVAQDSAATLEQLLQNVREQGSEASQQNRLREQEFRQRRNEQKAILDRTLADLRAEETRGQRLKAAFDQNERVLEELRFL